MQQPPPNYYGSPYPPSYPNQQNYPQNNPGQSYNNGNNSKPTGDYPRPGSEVPPPPSDVKTVDNDNTGSTFSMSNFKNRKITIYCTFPDSAIWHDKVFSGTLIDTSNEYMIILDDETKVYTTIVGVYVNFVEFKDESLFDQKSVR